MEGLFNINDVVIIKNSNLKKYKIIKINKKTFGCIDEENNELLINKTNADFEQYYSIDNDILYYVIIKYSNLPRLYEYEYKTLNLLFGKLEEYSEIDDYLKKQIYVNVSSNDYNYSYTTSNNVKIDIYKVDISEDTSSEVKCTCQPGFRGFSAFCEKHRN